MEGNNLEPFKILVIWDSQFENGDDYAQVIFDRFYRHENDYSGESIGIPVKFITNPGYKIDNELEGCEFISIVALIDNKMLIHKNDWAEILDKVFKNCSDKIRLYPVCCCSMEAIRNNSLDLARKNFITFESLGLITDSIERLNKRREYLIFELTHEFSRLLYGYNRVSELEGNSTPAGINIFISHSSEDGKKYAKDFNTYLTSNTSLDRFIDVFDIYKGDDFEATINANIRSAALLVLCTDSYSSREWCQHEVLYAKSKRRPILLVDMLKDGEKRRFPYMANIKTMHLDYGEISDEQKRNIILNILFEVLRVKYSELMLSYLSNIFGVKNISIFPYPPELLTLMLERKENSDLKTVLYPEPPLNKREEEILKISMPEVNFFTPTFLLLKNETLKGNLSSDLTVGLSVSDIPEKSLSKTNAQLKIMVVELSRYLIALGAKLVYGGSFTVKTQYNFLNILDDFISSYSVLKRKGVVKNIYIEDYPVEENKLVELGDVFEFEKLNTKEKSLAGRLTALREKVNLDSSVRISIGGKIEGYSGKLPGIIEESLIAIQMKKPLFVLGAYGGAAELLAKCIIGDEVDLREDLKVLAEVKEKGLTCLNNGLSDDENKKLLFSDNVIENIALIVKGLNTYNAKK